MPIMAPLADLLGVNREVAVLAFQFGDGLSNIVWPTGFAAIMAGMAGVKVEKWWKFVIPLFAVLFVVYLVIWYPFFKVYEKDEVAKENAIAE